ncbi:hypothetical protein LTR53_006179 [Teratosphaeriaceae sp. CCFEE 6253]|nr:hypothetical protein LTR53_006179 [Teratosphaeriaceae sp. CCFEE 6253]
MPSTTLRNLLPLALLLLPTALALPFHWPFSTHPSPEEHAVHFHAPGSHPHWSYTLTAASDPSLMTAPLVPTGYSYATGTGTATAGPTATGWPSKRDLEARHIDHFLGAPYSFPTAFPTGAYAAYPTATGTGTGAGYPTGSPAFPSWMHDHEHEHHGGPEHEHGGNEKRMFGGPRRHSGSGAGGAWQPTWAPWVHAPPGATAAASGSAPTGGYGGPTGVAPSGTGTGFVTGAPTGAW